MDQRSTIWLTNHDQQYNNNLQTNNPNQDPISSTFSGIKFLAIFTTSHLTISLMFIGLIVLLFGILSLVVSKLLYVTSDPLTGQAFHAIGIACVCISAILIITAIGIMVMAIRWARRKIYSLPQQTIQLKHHHHHHYPLTSFNHHQSTCSALMEAPYNPSAPPSETIGH